MAGQPCDQRSWAGLVDGYAHWHTLGHLDPVAGSVLGWKNRKLAAGTGPDRSDVPLQFNPRIGIEFDRSRLPDLHFGQIGFLEIRFDIAVRIGNDRYHRQAGYQFLTWQEPVGLGNPTRDWRPDDRARKIKLCSLPLGLSCGDRRQHAGNLSSCCQLGARFDLLGLSQLQALFRLGKLVLRGLERCLGGEAALPQRALALVICLCKTDILARSRNISPRHRRRTRECGGISLRAGDRRVGLGKLDLEGLLVDH